MKFSEIKLIWSKASPKFGFFSLLLLFGLQLSVPFIPQDVYFVNQTRLLVFFLVFLPLAGLLSATIAIILGAFEYKRAKLWNNLVGLVLGVIAIVIFIAITLGPNGSQFHCRNDNACPNLWYCAHEPGSAGICAPRHFEINL